MPHEENGEQNTETDSQLSPSHDSSHEQDQDREKLVDNIVHGFQEFAKIVEVIRKIEPEADEKGKLVVDLIKFRDFMAHKGVGNLDIVLVQMVNAFVVYCRHILELSQGVYLSEDPTEPVREKFARMADINVVICAKWFLNMYEKEQLSKWRTRQWLQTSVKGSSFNGLTFTARENNNDIEVTSVDGTARVCNIDWLNDLIETVHSSLVNPPYTADEINELRRLYTVARDLLLE